jgi:hypothetical protein
MELAGIDFSRIIYLTQRMRPAGQVYVPDAVQKLAQRYSFAKLPSVEELTRLPLTLSLGKFKDVQIDEFQIYNDGIIVSAKANTEILDAFISDLLSWSERELGLVDAPTAKPEKIIESAIIVKSVKDLALSLSPRNDVAEILNRTFRGELVGVGPYQLSGFFLDCDPLQFTARRKPMRFALERRLGVPFTENVFYSQAPLHTGDHLKVLSDLEALPTRRV